jgi:pimeloyl-ACP methyl ester carboxylesterase
MTRTVTLADGRRLAYGEWGDPGGFPVFYCHGTPGSRLEGAFADRPARSRQLRIVAPDRPGYGRSTFQPSRRFRDWPDDLSALSDSLGLARYGVVGHSGAGPHLFACGAFLPPERLAFVGALGPWGPVATPEIMAGLNRLDRLYARLAQRTPSVMRASFAPIGWCARYWPAMFVRLLEAAVSPPDKAALRDAEVRRVLRSSELEAFRQGGRGAAHEAGIAYRAWDFDLAQVRVPTHIWLGEEDIFVSREMGRYLERTIPGVDFRWVPGAGHLDVSLWDGILTACTADV